MKTPLSTLYHYNPETVAHANKLTAGTVSENAHKRGMEYGEPLIVAMDCLLTYAKAYQRRFDQPLANDGMLGDQWLESVKGVRGLLNGDGSIALLKGKTTDSKDNGCVEGVFWDALKVAGFTEETANL